MKEEVLEIGQRMTHRLLGVSVQVISGPVIFYYVRCSDGSEVFVRDTNLVPLDESPVAPSA